MPDKKTITIICGPTASGKSAMAMEIARDRNGVVINADSLQVYNALPLLTAQPGEENKAEIPHRLYAFLDPATRYSAQQWCLDAEDEIAAALDSGLHPVVVGGTGLYLKALVEGLSPMPDVPEATRAEAAALQARLGNPGFHAALQDIDPVMADRLHPNDTQRLIRAYEVMAATGKSLSLWHAAPLQPPPEDWQFDILIKSPERAELHRRCDRRFDMMLESGALEEVEAHLNLSDAAPVTHALGFRPLRDYLRGAIALADAVEMAKAETRQYAKRQDTWFRHQIRPNPSIARILRVS